MRAVKLQIIERKRERMSQIASLDNFQWTESGSFDAQQILTNPNISLYCFDEARRWAVFVVLPDHLDLTHAPFTYLAQFENASELIAIPYMTLFSLAESVDVDASKLILVHNIGRCGSTLLCQALNAVPSVYALSEPDVFASPIPLRYTEDEHQRALLVSSLRLLFRPVIVGDASHYVVKLRNQCVDVIEIFADAFPLAQHVFMYRNAIDWVASLYRLFIKNRDMSELVTRQDALERQASYVNRYVSELTHFLPDDIQTLTRTTELGFSWLMMMSRFQHLCDKRPDVVPMILRYEDLTTQPESMLHKIWEQLALPASSIADALTVFERDSQAGTRLARDDESGNTTRLPSTEIENLESLLQTQPVINKPDVILADTLTP